MTLHNTTELAKKVGIAGSIGLGAIFMIFIFVKIGGVIKAILFPPKIAPANEAYGKIPDLLFPASAGKGDYTYTVDTLNGSLPKDFPDRLNIYQMNVKKPSLLDLKNVKNKVDQLGFTDINGTPLPEIPRGGSSYEWDETTGFQRKIIFDVVSQNFTLTSNYLTSLTVLNAQNLGNEITAEGSVQGFLSDIKQMPTDIDLNLTKDPDPAITYTTKPILYAISNGQLIKTTSLSNAQVIRVDLFQKEVDYTINAGLGDLTHFQDFDMKLPIMYPHPPYSTMNFLVASGSNQADVVEADFSYQSPNLTPDADKLATYPIKSATEAFNELKNGNGYIASYYGTDNQILINKVYLAYYIGEKQQQYLMPIVVFEGQDGFFAYVSAVKDTALQ